MYSLLVSNVFALVPGGFLLPLLFPGVVPIVRDLTWSSKPALTGKPSLVFLVANLKSLKLFPGKRLSKGNELDLATTSSDLGFGFRIYLFIFFNLLNFYPVTRFLVTPILVTRYCVTLFSSTSPKSL